MIDTSYQKGKMVHPSDSHLGFVGEQPKGEILAVRPTIKPDSVTAVVAVRWPEPWGVIIEDVSKLEPVSSR